MRLEDIARGQFLEGIAPDAPACILAASPIGPDALAVHYRDADGSLGERLLGRQHEPFVRVPARRRPWAFDADGQAFQQAAIDCLDPADRPANGVPARHGSTLQRGVFLLDPSRQGLEPSLLLLIAHHGALPGASALARRVLCVAADPMRGTFLASPTPFRRLQPIDPILRKPLQELLHPLLANHRIREQAVAFAASQLVAAASPAAFVTPPVLLGAAILVSADLIRWLRHPEGGPCG